jgi:hypothetical protein
VATRKVREQYHECNCQGAISHEISEIGRPEPVFKRVDHSKSILHHESSHIKVAASSCRTHHLPLSFFFLAMITSFCPSTLSFAWISWSRSFSFHLSEVQGTYITIFASGTNCSEGCTPESWTTVGAWKGLLSLGSGKLQRFAQHSPTGRRCERDMGTRYRVFEWFSKLIYTRTHPAPVRVPRSKE